MSGGAPGAGTVSWGSVLLSFDKKIRLLLFSVSCFCLKSFGSLFVFLLFSLLVVY